MGFWKDVAKWTVGALGSAATGALAATGFGIPVAALTAAWTAAVTTGLALDSAEEDDQAKREEQLNQATDNANKAKDLTDILDSAEEDIKISGEIRHKEEITPEEKNKALDHLTQGYIKVAGIALSVNPQKNDPEIIKRIQAIGERVSQERISWRGKLHKDYNIDMVQTQEEAQKQKNQLQDLLNKLEGKEGEDAQVLRSQIQEEIDYLEGKVSPEYQSFVDERRKEVEDLKTLKREHEEAFKKAKESVQNNAVTGVEDAEKALEKRAEFDSKFKEFLNQLRSKKEDLPHVLTPDILISIADFYSVFRDPELLHNEVFATAYKQQAERNEQVVFDTPLSAYRKAKEHLARSVELYKIYEKHIDNKEFTLARKLRFQVEAHQREAVRIAEQIPAKFSIWEGGTAKEKIATAWSGLKNAFKLGDKKSLVESLNSQINAHGDTIHKAMHLADLGEDDFYRNGLEATKNYFIQDGIKSKDRSALIGNVEEKIPDLDARERAKEEQEQAQIKAKAEAERQEKERETEQARLKAEQEAKAKSEEDQRLDVARQEAERKEDEQSNDQEEDLDLSSVPNTPIQSLQEPEPKAKAEDQEEDDEEFESNLEARLNALGSGSVFEENDGDEGEQEETTEESPMLESPMLEGGEDTHASVFSQYASTLAKDKEEEKERLKAEEQEEAQKQEEERKAQIKAEEEAKLKAAEQDKKIEQKLKSGFQRNEQEDDEEFEARLEARLNALGSDPVSEEEDEYVSDRLRAELSSDDLEEKLQALRDLPDPEPPLSPPSEALREPVITQQYQQAVAERERFLTSVEDDDDLRVYGVSRKDGKLVQRLLKKAEKPRSDEGTAYGYDCIIRLPPIDTGDAFNNFSGKKIRIFKGSIKVINTSDVEVGVYGEEMHPIEELIGSPKTGEFPFPIYSNSQHLPELVIKHKGEHSHFHLTSVTTHFSVED